MHEEPRAPFYHLVNVIEAWVLIEMGRTKVCVRGPKVPWSVNDGGISRRRKHGVLSHDAGANCKQVFDDEQHATGKTE